MTNVVILGCGFTGVRVACRLLARGCRVVATTRNQQRRALLESRGALVLPAGTGDPDSLRGLRADLPKDCLVLHSIPPLRQGDVYEDPTPGLLDVLGDRPRRIVYLSTTGVYGSTLVVNEQTPAAARTPRERLRLQAEDAVSSGSWNSLILRPAAIYGPGRGVHEAMRRGAFRLRGDGDNFVSRVHVEDLATHAEAALFSDVAGRFPVADDEPCESRVIARFCAELLGLPMPDAAAPAELSETRRSNRRVDGTAIRKLLGITLRYPSFRSGIPASLESERRGELC